VAAELKAPAIEFMIVDGAEAKIIDPAHLDWPDDSKVVFVVQDDNVVGRSSMFTLPMIAILNLSMIEGTWIAEEKRGTSLAARLIKKVESVFRENGKTHAYAFAYDEHPEVADYLQRFGFQKMPLTIYMKQL
jgi:N-acetylglutamate synthase-like GNAT family acetyltransferase